MVDLASALERLFSQLDGLGPQQLPEELPLEQAHGRLLAEDVTPDTPVPGEPRAAMDGFAVCGGAPAGSTLAVAGQVLAGEAAAGVLGPGVTVFVATGAPLPPGADTVVPRELAEWPGAGREAPPAGTAVRVRRSVPAGANVLAPGEWIPADAPALPAGTRLTPPALAVLASLGRATVRVRRRPRVVVVPTGNELVQPGQSLRPGGTFESNAAMLGAACREAGAEVQLLPPVADDPDLLHAALARALGYEPTLVLTTGGVSVGPADLVPAAWLALGAREIFWRVAIKPGKPVFAARRGATAVLGFSGSPAACWTAFTILGAPLLRHWAGWRHPFPPPQRVSLACGIAGRGDVPRLLWSEVDPDGRAYPAPRRAPGTLPQLARANALVLLAAGAGPLAAGEGVWALRSDRVGEPGEADPRALLASLARTGRGGRPQPAVPGWVRAAGAAGPAVCAVGGRSGHGKTVLIERLIQVLVQGGERVATLKHHGHGTPLDAPGKDGFRHRAAGASLTVVSGPGGLIWSESVSGEVPLERCLEVLGRRAAAIGCHWLLVEGYHEAVLPRVEVLDTAQARSPLSDPAHGLFLVAASDPAAAEAPPGVPVVGRDDIAAVAAALRRTCRPG
jgi:molybdopterin molybdotransferase